MIERYTHLFSFKHLFIDSIKNISAILLVSIVCACSSEQSEKKRNIPLTKISEFNTSHLAPNSYLISSPILALGDSMIYYDKSVERAIITDSLFNYLGYLTEGNGTGPDQIGVYVNHSITSKYIVMVGASELMFYDRLKLHLIRKFPIPNLDLKWVAEFKNKLYLGAFNYDQNTYGVFLLEIADNNLAYTKVKEISFDDRLDWSIKGTQALVDNDYLYILKSEVGEIIKLDSAFSVVFNKQLPYSFSKEHNYVETDEGNLDLNYYECRSATIKNGLLYILRYYDVYENDKMNKDSFRSCVQIFNSNIDFLGQMTLPEKATGISFYKNRLIGVDYYDENYNIYEVSF